MNDYSFTKFDSIAFRLCQGFFALNVIVINGHFFS
jgi:hypothetical protein